MQTEDIRDLVGAVRRLAGWRRHAEEQTVARLETLNESIQSLSRAGGLAPMSVLGDPLLEYDPTTAGEKPGTSIIHQCALLTPLGVGILRWDGAALSRAKENPGSLDAEAPLHFIPYAACDSAIKRLLHANLNTLLERVVEELRSQS
jgi:hypothetical protein